MIEGPGVAPHCPDADGYQTSTLIVAANVKGLVFVCDEGLSIWGGVDPETGTVIDTHHSQCAACFAGRVVLMPTSRGSCSGSGVLLELAMNGHAPAALVFRETEDILTPGALVATRMFDCSLAVMRLSEEDYATLAIADKAEISGASLLIDGDRLALAQVDPSDLKLTDFDRSVLEGANGTAAQLAMEIICAMAPVQGVEELLDVTRAHIDGCIYASPANLTFAEAIVAMGGKVAIATTMMPFQSTWKTGRHNRCRGISALPPAAWRMPMSKWVRSRPSPAHLIKATTNLRRAKLSDGRNLTQSSTPTAFLEPELSNTRIFLICLSPLRGVH